MDYDFESESKIWIPKAAYQPYKRCEFCQSVYLTDNICESCGRSVRYDLVGEAFGYKSFYGIKERYVSNLSFWVQHFPSLEDKKVPEAKMFVRQLKKRLSDLSKLDDLLNQKLFYLEASEIINELVLFGVNIDEVRLSVGDNFELENLLVIANQNKFSPPKWSEKFIMKFLLFIIILATAVQLSLRFYK